MAKKGSIASVLAFEKKLVPSDAYLYGTTWADKTAQTPLMLQEKSVRGTISNRLKQAIKNDPVKLNAEVEKANLQRVDACSLSVEQDTLKVQFTLKVLGNIVEPSACNNAAFKQSYAKASADYIETHGFTELAKRYATNIANGRFLWRNRIGAENIEVQVNVLNKEAKASWVFNAKEYNIKDFSDDDKDLTALAERIALALSSTNDFLMLDIVCFAQIGKAQEVYPSEELVLDKGKGEKSKILYQNNGQAAMHSQKIGNAIRTIDTWYSDFTNPEESAGPIAIEPYGSVTNLGRAYRTPKAKQDFFTLFDGWAQGETISEKDAHYVMAVLVRGGVFGESEKGN